MKQYSTYNFYISQYGGETLTEDQFNKAAKKASAYIDKITFGKAKDYTETGEHELQMCTCEMAEAIRSHEDNLSHGKVVSSASNQGYSETYAVPDTSSTVKVLSYDLFDIARLYLPYEILEVCVYED